MKITAALLLFYSAASMAQARLGETPDQIAARFGTCIDSTTLQNGSDAGLNLRQYSKQGFTILVYFKKVSIEEDYQTRRLAEPQIQDLLSANSEGYQWTEKPTARGRFWVRGDGATAHLTDSEIDFKAKVFINKQIKFTKAQRPSIDGF
jgi:hypothetical protein